MKPPTRPTRARLEVLIVEHGGNMSKVARALGVARQTLYTVDVPARPG